MQKQSLYEVYSFKRKKSIVSLDPTIFEAINKKGAFFAMNIGVISLFAILSQWI